MLTINTQVIGSLNSNQCVQILSVIQCSDSKFRKCEINISTLAVFLLLTVKLGNVILRGESNTGKSKSIAVHPVVNQSKKLVLRQGSTRCWLTKQAATNSRMS